MADQSKAEHSGNVGAVLLAFVIGAVAGATVALLYAPGSGQEMRDFLGDKARDAARKASEAARVGREVIKEVYEEAGGDHA